MPERMRWIGALLVALALAVALGLRSGGPRTEERREIPAAVPSSKPLPSLEDRITALEEEMARKPAPALEKAPGHSKLHPGRSKPRPIPGRPTKIGEFELVSGSVVLSDPGYELDVVEIGMARVVNDCRTGRWRVRVTTKMDPEHKFDVPDVLEAVHRDARKLTWEKLEIELGGDHAMVGIYDLSHFHDHSLVPKNQIWTVGGDGPADPGDLWYSLICEAIVTAGPVPAAVIPFGAVLSWDSGVEASLGRDSSGKVAGITLRAR